VAPNNGLGKILTDFKNSFSSEINTLN